MEISHPTPMGRLGLAGGDGTVLGVEGVHLVMGLRVELSLSHESHAKASGLGAGQSFTLKSQSFRYIILITVIIIA